MLLIAKIIMIILNFQAITSLEIITYETDKHMYNVIPLNRSLPFQMKQELLEKMKAGQLKKKVFKNLLW